MSALRDIQTLPWIHKHGTKIFFETGTGLGSGLMRMLQPEYGFNMLLSVEIDKELAAHSHKTFSFDNRIQIFNTTGIQALEQILPQLPVHVPIFFWIDSHFSNSDYNLGDKPLVPHDTDAPEIRLPAFKEMELIKNIRTNRGAKDFILLDDAMLYDELDRYEDRVERLGLNAVPPEYRKLLPKIINLFQDSHKAQVITMSQGFLALHPK